MRTRIEVPTTVPELSPPHFDDEATIITARPVVPIARARVTERSRVLLGILPTALAAALFGGLGALGVSYIQNRQSPMTRLETRQESQASQPLAPESAPVTSQPELPVSAATASPDAEPENGETEPAVVAKQEGFPADRVPAAITPSGEPASLPPTKPAVSGPGETKANDPGRLIRKRRVHPTPEPQPESRAKKKNRGAGRISDIFEGPNPW